MWDAAREARLIPPTLLIDIPDVTRNDDLLHASLGNAPFGGVGGSGTGRPRRQGRLRRVTHRRTVAARAGPQGFTDGMVGSALLAPELTAGIDQAITGVAAEIRTRLGP
ncbi:hypothetical protein ACFZC6_02445 [Streptomyces ossamyceticus]|uniref:hypothetical protein n=1 Tax=Streptomyces ossamyceticus TaxID=249581 RepID=UPI0036E68D56